MYHSFRGNANNVQRDSQYYSYNNRNSYENSQRGYSTPHRGRGYHNQSRLECTVGNVAKVIKKHMNAGTVIIVTDMDIKYLIVIVNREMMKDSKIILKIRVIDMIGEVCGTIDKAPTEDKFTESILRENIIMISHTLQSET